MLLKGTYLGPAPRLSYTSIGEIYAVYGIIVEFAPAIGQSSVSWLICDQNYRDLGWPVQANGRDFEVIDGTIPNTWVAWGCESGLHVGSSLERDFPNFMERVIESDPAALAIWAKIKTETEEALA